MKEQPFFFYIMCINDWVVFKTKRQAMNCQYRVWRPIWTYGVQDSPTPLFFILMYNRLITRLLQTQNLQVHKETFPSSQSQTQRTKHASLSVRPKQGDSPPAQSKSEAYQPSAP